MSDLQAAIEGRLATIVQCTNVKPCAMCDRQAEIIRTDLAALLEQAQREPTQRDAMAALFRLCPWADSITINSSKASEPSELWTRRNVLPPTGDAAP